MSEITTSNNQANNSSSPLNNGSNPIINFHHHKVKKSQINFLKISLLFTLIFLSILAYFFWQDLSRRKIIASKDSEKLNSFENDIFDLADEYKNQNYTDDTGDLHVDPKDFKEKNIEFIFRLLLKNQGQIELIKRQNQELKEEFLKYKNFEKFNKMAIAYISLRDKIIRGGNYRHELQNFEISSIHDDFIKSKIAKIKDYIELTANQEALKNSFKKLIPEIKSLDVKIYSDNTLINSINQKISKVIMIRRTVANNSDDVDDKIIAIENAINNNDWQEVMKVVLSFDQNYKSLFTQFLEQINAMIELQKIDQEIINYFNNIS